jgi:hypothetical protein
MSSPLLPCPLPFRISKIPITEDETTLFLKCHDRMFSHVTVVSPQGHELFTGSGPGPIKSWSWRRQVTDTFGIPIFDLRHHGWAMKNLWTVESPGGEHVVDLKNVNAKRRSDLDMVFGDGKGEGEEVVKVRQKDQSGIVTEVFFEEKCIGGVQLEGSNDVVDLSQVDRSSWKVRIVGGVDPAVVSRRIVLMERLKLTFDLDLGHSSLSS